MQSYYNSKLSTEILYLFGRHREPAISQGFLTTDELDFVEDNPFLLVIMKVEGYLYHCMAAESTLRHDRLSSYPTKPKIAERKWNGLKGL